MFRNSVFTAGFKCVILSSASIANMPSDRPSRICCRRLRSIMSAEMDWSSAEAKSFTDAASSPISPCWELSARSVKFPLAMAKATFLTERKGRSMVDTAKIVGPIIKRKATQEAKMSEKLSEL